MVEPAISPTAISPTVVSPAQQRRRWLADLFVAANLAFLALDIALAHSVNKFAHKTEWIPFGFSILATLLLIPGLVRRQWWSVPGRHLALVLGATSIVVGVLGMFLHLGSHFFVEQTLRNLVYAAPFAAPLAYSGVGFILLLNRLEPEGELDWGRWILLLAGGGFLGSFAVALGDHAQNGFFFASEWISVIAAAFGTTFLLVAIVFPRDVRLLRWCVAVMVLQGGVGVLGFAFHAYADWQGPAQSLLENVTQGAPIFAPLLLSNLAILAGLGLWELFDASRQ